jgi:hypothetical protein
MRFTSRRSRGGDPGETELRGYDGLRHQVRIEHLARTLTERTVAVAHCANAAVADRTTLWLDDGAVLRLRLYRANRAVVAALVAIVWDDDVGWIVHARGADGASVRLIAWQAELVPPS